MQGIVLFSFFIFGLIGFFFMLGGAHKIYEGHIGVYSRGGALLQTYTDPGIHFMIPVVTSYHSVQVTVQTDKVTNIPCGTSSGVMIYFDKIEVVNRLKKSLAYQTIKNYTVNYDKTWIFDKIHHEINQFCSSHTLHEVYVSMFNELDDNLKEALQRGCDQYAPGIEIIAVRVTKPGIPVHISMNYEEMEREKTKLLITKESQKVKAKEGETDKILKRISAETAAAVNQILMEEQLAEKEGRQKMEEIENQINFEREKTFADAENYKRLKEIEINQKKLTKEYRLYTAAESIKGANKHYFGDSIPKYFETNMNIFGQEKESQGGTGSQKTQSNPTEIGKVEQ